MLNDLLPHWIQNLEKSDLQKALETTSNPDIISFSLGRPDNNLLTIPGTQNYKDLLTSKNLQYSLPSPELKTHITKLMKEKNISCTPNQIFLTTGAQQAMTLLTRLLTAADDNILIDQVAYPGYIQIAQAIHANLIPIPVCFQNGIIIEELKKVIEENKKPSLIYTMSEGHNPLGLSLSKKQRIELVKLVEQYRIPIIEDDAYGFLNYEAVEAPLKSYWNEGVFYIGSFSKIIAPSMRVGWIIAPESIMEKLEILKEGLDINTSTLSQKFISQFFENNELKRHISKLRKEYQDKRDIMIKSLKKYIPEMKFSTPKSGFFIWGNLPSSINTNKLFKIALEEENVSFLPGSAFLIGEREETYNCLRLSFAFCPKELIETGIRRLAKAIKRYKWMNEEQFLRAV